MLQKERDRHQPLDQAFPFHGALVLGIEGAYGLADSVRFQVLQIVLILVLFRRGDWQALQFLQDVLRNRSFDGFDQIAQGIAQRGNYSELDRDIEEARPVNG